MTIIVLEGVNGTGKTTYASRLSQGLNAPVIRPFRQGLDHHFTGETRIERDLQALGVPYNTHVDDLYTADILGRMLKHNKRTHAILDRSVGSAIAHGERPLRDAGPLIGLWQKLLGEDSKVVYVWLTAPSGVCCERMASDGREADVAQFTLDHKRLQGLFRIVFEMIGYTKLEIDTTTLPVDSGVLKIVELVSHAKAW